MRLSTAVLEGFPETAASAGGIYLDHHATTPLDRRVSQSMIRYMHEEFGNANSIDHLYGERAAQAVETAAEQVAALLSAGVEDVVFTSGSTQAIELAFSNALGKAGGRPLRIGLSRVEHSAVIDVATRAQRRGLATLHWLNVARDASVDMGGLERLLTEVDLICLMAANNEVGTIYPVSDIYRLAASSGTAMLVDATQAAGRMTLDLSDTPFDYLVLSGHKMYGPKGIGALISQVYDARDNYGIAGSHAPTPNVPAVVGFGVACGLMAEEGGGDEARIGGLSALLLDRLRLQVPGLVLNGATERLAGNLHVSAPGAPNDLVLSRLRGSVAISTGAACMSGADGPSHVLQAMALPVELQESALRIGLGRHTTGDDVLKAAQLIASAVAAVRDTLGHSHA